MSSTEVGKSYVYLHGFASSPASSKAQFFLARLAEQGETLLIPELEGGDFEHLTLRKQLATLDRIAAHGTVVLIGSSLGGYLASLYAETHPHVERLILLAPAFDLVHRWTALMGTEKMQQWKKEGSVPMFHYGAGTTRNIGYGFFEDALSFPAYPEVRQPTLVLQGLHDETVPPESAREFCRRNPSAALHLFDSGHQLTDVLEQIWAVAEPFLFL